MPATFSQTPPSCWKHGQSKLVLSHTLVCPFLRYFSTFVYQQVGLFQGKTFLLRLCLCCFRLQPRTEAFLGALVSKRVDCRDALLSVWKTEDKCEDLMCLAWHCPNLIWLAFLLFVLVVLSHIFLLLQFCCLHTASGYLKPCIKK